MKDQQSGPYLDWIITLPCQLSWPRDRVNAGGCPAGRHGLQAPASSRSNSVWCSHPRRLSSCNNIHSYNHVLPGSYDIQQPISHLKASAIIYEVTSDMHLVEVESRKVDMKTRKEKVSSNRKHRKVSSITNEDFHLKFEPLMSNTRGALCYLEGNHDD